jgi:hypothetical protein
VRRIFTSTAPTITRHWLIDRAAQFHLSAELAALRVGVDQHAVLVAGLALLLGLCGC